MENLRYRALIAPTSLLKNGFWGIPGSCRYCEARISEFSSINFSKAAPNFDLILAIDKVIATIISKLALQVQEANNSGFGMGGIMAVAVFSIMKINVFLILMLIFFNIPYLIFYFRRKDKTTSPFLLYLIPLIIFIVLSFISTYVGSILLQAYTSSSSFPF